MKVDNTHTLLYVIAVTVSINLIVSVWVLKRMTSEPPMIAEFTEMVQLPEHITSEVLKDIYKNFREAYNSHDNDVFWELFAPFYQSKMNKNDMTENYQKMIKMFDTILDGSYSHHEIIGSDGNMNLYILHYDIMFSEPSVIGDEAVVNITIFDDGKEFGIIGTFISQNIK